MRIAFSVQLCVLALLLPVSAVSADIHQCDGRWTNLPCSGKVEKTLDNKTTLSVMKPAAALAATQNRSLVHELQMAAIAARREYGITVDTAELEELCLKTATTTEPCRDAVNATHEQLDEKIARIESLRSQQRIAEAHERANRLQEEANAEQARRNQLDYTHQNTVSGSDQQVIINNIGSGTDVVINPGSGRYPHRRRHHGYGPPRRYEQPGTSMLWKRSGSPQADEITNDSGDRRHRR